jgi:gliding motility-associated-like protein
MNNISGLPISTYTIDSHLNTNHTFEWKDGLGTIIGAASTFTATVPGDYSLIATNSTTGCISEEVFVSVLPSSIAITGYSVTENFVDNQVITVVASGYGGANDAFLYQLDGGLFQESNIFENVASGQHTVIVRDKYGCGDSAPFDVLVVNYPKFFTPNGDGFNDYWNISDLNLLDTAKISIFNREGKLVKQISTSGQGWDGNFNGVALPASDYWFSVNYTEDGLSKEFKSHFTLKR